MLSSLLKSHLIHEKEALECGLQALLACVLFSGPLFILSSYLLTVWKLFFLGSASNPLLKRDDLK